MTTRPNAQRAPKHASKAKHIKHRTITPRTSAKRCNNQPTPSASESSEIRTIQITDGLPEEKKKLVTALMMEIPGHWKSYGSLRTDLGKKLQELQTVFAQAGKNGRFVHCLRKLKIPKATAYEQIKRYERISPLPLVLKKSAESEGIDLAAPRIQKRLAEQTLSLDNLTEEQAKKIIAELKKKPAKHTSGKFGPGITEGEKQTYQLYDAMRKVTGSILPKDKLAALQTALNWLAKYDNICTKPLQITITPTAAKDDWVLMPSFEKTQPQEVK
jgi:hypothetical protein